jgi:hypothetical protein
MRNIYAFSDGGLRPVDIFNIMYEQAVSGLRETRADLRRGVIENSAPLAADRLVLAGNPFGVTASKLRYGRDQPSGSEFNEETFLENLFKIGARYDEGIIFVMGDHGTNPSYYAEKVFPVVPFRINGRNLPTEYEEVGRPLFRFDEQTQTLVSVSPLRGEDTPQCVVALRRRENVAVPGQEYVTRFDVSMDEAGIPHASADKHVNRMLPDDAILSLPPSNVVLIASPAVFCRYGGNYIDSDPSGARINNRTGNFLAFAETGLPDFAPGKIARVIGDVRGDSYYTFFSYAMFGYKPGKES